MHIAITTLPGYTRQEKILLARRLKMATAELMDIAPVSISVSAKDLLIEDWDEFIHELPDEEIIIPETSKSCCY